MWCRGESHTPHINCKSNKKPSDRPEKGGRFCVIKKNCGDVSGNVSAASILSVRVYSYFMYFCRRKVVKDFLQNPERETGENPVQNPLLWVSLRGNAKGHCRRTGRRSSGNKSENLPRCVVIASGGRRMQKCLFQPLYSEHWPKHLLNLNAEDYAFL